MKLLLLISLVIVVFKANCSSSQDLPDPGNGVQNFPGEEQVSVGEDQYVNNEIERHDSVESSEESEESDESQDLSLAIENQEFVKEEKGEIERKSKKPRCKATIICVALGGFCVTNATLCSGRLIPKACKRSSCQCCVPRSLDNKIQNLTIEIQSLRTNFNSSKLKMDMKFGLMEDNFTDSISNITSNLNHYVENTGNFSKKIANEIQSIKSSINGNKLNIDSKMKLMEDKIMKSISYINSKLNADCTGGFQIARQCFVFYKDRARSWTDANNYCRSKGYILAEPADSIVVTLRRYLYTNYGHGNDVWVGARGNGSGYLWQKKRNHLSNSSPLWQPGDPGSKSSSYCVEMNLHSGSLSSQPLQPYDDQPCSSTEHTLCEVLIQ